jgi:hypothetical protein
MRSELVNKRRDTILTPYWRQIDTAMAEDG